MIARKELEFTNGAQDFLGGIHRAWPGSRFHFAVMVGIVLDNSNRGDFVVGRLS